MSQSQSLPPKAILVGSGVHVASARVMLVEAGFTIAEELTHPSVVGVVLERLKTASSIDIPLLVFVLSETYRLEENRVIGELLDRKIVCVGSSNDWHRRDTLTQLGVSAYVQMTEAWPPRLYERLVELRKEIEATK